MRNPRGRCYEDEGLYCAACKVQPECFVEVIHRQVNMVRKDGTLIETKEETVEYQCPRCEEPARWGYEFDS